MNTVKFESAKIRPSKIVCIGRNYVKHIEELGNAIPEQMVVFNKPNSAISSSLKSFNQEALHYEAEICFLVRNEQLFAVGVGLDLTKRGLQSKLKDKGLPWERAKAFDGSALFSEFVSFNGFNVDHFSLELYINDEKIQSGNVQEMLYPPQTILKELASYTTLQDNDLIMSGTPSGVGQVQRGDIFIGRIKCDSKVIVEAKWVAD